MYSKDLETITLSKSGCFKRGTLDFDLKISPRVKVQHLFTNFLLHTRAHQLLGNRAEWREKAKDPVDSMAL